VLLCKPGSTAKHLIGDLKGTDVYCRYAVAAAAAAVVIDINYAKISLFHAEIL